MKLKLFVLLLAVCLVLIGCDSTNAKNPTNGSNTTAPSQNTSDPTGNGEPTEPVETEDPLLQATLPEEIHGIELPFDEFTDDVPPPVPVTNPTEPEEESPTEATEPTVNPETGYTDPDNLPMDEWE